MEDICAPLSNGHDMKEVFGERIEVYDIPGATPTLLFEGPEIISEKINAFLKRLSV